MNHKYEYMTLFHDYILYIEIIQGFIKKSTIDRCFPMNFISPYNNTSYETLKYINI